MKAHTIKKTAIHAEICKKKQHLIHGKFLVQFTLLTTFYSAYKFKHKFHKSEKRFQKEQSTNQTVHGF